MSHQGEIKYMLSTLKQMNKNLGGTNARRRLAGSEFQFTQEEFLSRRNDLEKLVDEKQREGVTTKNADINFRIREGLKELKQLLRRLQSELKKIKNKKKDPPEVIQKRQKITENCELLYYNIEERIGDSTNQHRQLKPMTITDMKAKLLEQIDINNIQIHQATSEDGLDEMNEQQLRAIQEFDRADEEMDRDLDQIIDGVQRVRGQVKQINQKQDEVNQKVQKNKKNIEKMSKRIEKDNDKLKKIIQQFKPNRCCLAIVLLLLLIGLVVIIIKMLIPTESTQTTTT